MSAATLSNAWPVLCSRAWGVTGYDSDYCFNCLSLFVRSFRRYDVMTFFDCTADSVGQRNGNGQTGMLQIDAPPVENFCLCHWLSTKSPRRFNKFVFSRRHRLLIKGISSSIANRTSWGLELLRGRSIASRHVRWAYTSCNNVLLFSLFHRQPTASGNRPANHPVIWRAPAAADEIIRRARISRMRRNETRTMINPHFARAPLSSRSRSSNAPSYCRIILRLLKYCRDGVNVGRGGRLGHLNCSSGWDDS